jgi:hypothetical protein
MLILLQEEELNRGDFLFRGQHDTQHRHKGTLSTRHSSSGEELNTVMPVLHLSALHQAGVYLHTQSQYRVNDDVAGMRLAACAKIAEICCHGQPALPHWV